MNSVFGVLITETYFCQPLYLGYIGVIKIILSASFPFKCGY